MAAERTARFFVDENDLALGRSLSWARRDVVHPGHRDLPSVPLGTADSVWLQIVGEMVLVVITRDKRIRSRPVESAAVAQAGVRGFVLTSAGDLSTWLTLSLLVREWDAIERHLSENPGCPWLAAVANQGVRPLNLRRQR
ncbi:MAG: hypothetical protein ACKVWR_17775 [Acidimicrobiales bacterium]